MNVLVEYHNVHDDDADDRVAKELLDAVRERELNASTRDALDDALTDLVREQKDEWLDRYAADVSVRVTVTDEEWAEFQRAGLTEEQVAKLPIPGQVDIFGGVVECSELPNG